MDFGNLKGSSYLTEIQLQEAIIKSTEATSSGVGVRIRSADDSTDADMIARRVVGQSLALGEVDIYIRPGNLAPTNPTIGDLWFEIGAQSEQLYGWPWSWSGSYWLSPEHSLAAEFGDINSGRFRNFTCEQSLDYFFEKILVCGGVATTNGGSNTWSFQLERINSSRASTVVGGAIATTSQAANTDFALESTLNLHVDVSAVTARRFRLVAQKNATPGNFDGAMTAVFRYARP